MAQDDPFSLGGVEDQGLDTADQQRKRRLSLYHSLTAQPGTQDPAADMEEQPLYGGDVSKPTQEEVNPPSQLATERVQRAPVTEVASPLLGADERRNAAVDEANRGEEGDFGPQLSSGARQRHLSDYFGNLQQAGEGQGGSSESTSRDVGGAGQAASQAIGYSKLSLGGLKNLLNWSGADKPANTWLNDLFGTGRANNLPDFSTYYGQAPEGSGFSSYYGSMPVGGDAASLDNFGQVAEGAEAAGGVSNFLGPITSGAGLGLSLAGLINDIVSGNADESRTGNMSKTAVMSVPAIVSLLSTIAPSLGISALAGPTLGAATLPLLVGTIMDLIKGPPGLPAGAKNLSQMKSRFAGEQIPGQLNDWLLQQNNPLSLIGLATGARPLSPNQEVLMYGGGNLWGSDPYNAMLEGILNGDQQATQDFLRSVEIQSGETGGVHHRDDLATDTYRRQLAHALGLTNEQTQGMFQSTPFQYYNAEGERNVDPNAWDINRRMSNTIATMRNGQFSEDELMSLYNALPSYGAEGYGDFARMSPYYQDPYAGRLRPEDVQAYQDAIMDYINSHHTDPYAYLMGLYNNPGGDQ